MRKIINLCRYWQEVITTSAILQRHTMSSNSNRVAFSRTALDPVPVAQTAEAVPSDFPLVAYIGTADVASRLTGGRAQFARALRGPVARSDVGVPVEVQHASKTARTYLSLQALLGTVLRLLCLSLQRAERFRPGRAGMWVVGSCIST